MAESYRSEFPDFRLNANPDVLKRWHEIFRSKQRITVPAHAIIAEQGKQAKNLYYIESGLVEYTYIDRDGKCSFLEILGDHCVFPLQPMFGNNAMVGAFSALETCELDVIGIEEIYAYLRRDNDLALEFLAEFGQITGGHLRQISMDASGTVNRVEQVLCLLAEYRQRHTRKGAPLMIGLSQIDLARITKTTRVTVTKVLSELKQKGIVKTTYGGLIVTDLEALRCAAHDGI